MVKKGIYALVVAATCLVVAPGVRADEGSASSGAASASASASQGIPFRREVQTLPEQSFSALITTVSLLAAVAGLLWYVRKQLPALQGKPTAGKLSSLTIVERAHVHGRLSLYVARYRDKEILLAQSGNQLVVLSEFPAPESPGVDQ